MLVYTNDMLNAVIKSNRMIGMVLMFRLDDEETYDGTYEIHLIVEGHTSTFAIKTGIEDSMEASKLLQELAADYKIDAEPGEKVLH